MVESHLQKLAWQLRSNANPARLYFSTWGWDSPISCHSCCVMATLPSQSKTLLTVCRVCTCIARGDSSSLCDRMTTFWRWDIFSALNGPTPMLLSAAPSSSSAWSRRRPWLETAPPSCTMSTSLSPLWCRFSVEGHKETSRCRNSCSD